MVLINPVTMVFVPYEIRGERDQFKIKRDDLPRFETQEEVRKFMAAHPRIHRRFGKFVKLTWLGHDEAWALAEYAKELGKWPS